VNSSRFKWDWRFLERRADLFGENLDSFTVSHFAAQKWPNFRRRHKMPEMAPELFNWLFRRYTMGDPRTWILKAATAY
jgi:hypothetical protein